MPQGLTRTRTIIRLPDWRIAGLPVRTVAVPLTHALVLLTLARGALAVFRTTGPKGLARTCAIVGFPYWGITGLPIGTVAVTLTHTSIFFALAGCAFLVSNSAALIYIFCSVR